MGEEKFLLYIILFIFYLMQLLKQNFKFSIVNQNSIS